MRRFFITSISLVLLSALASCVSGDFLRTEGIRRTEEITGTYRLILFGATYPDDLETAAFLDVEGDGYEFVPYAPKFRYAVYEGFPAEKAFKAAEHFVGFHRSFNGFLLKRVISVGGAVVGYEVRPLYVFYAVGSPDVLDIGYYEQGDGNIQVLVRVKEEILRLRDIERSDHGR